MNQRRSDKIGKMLALETSKERRDAAITGKLQRRLDEQVTRLGELNAYRQGYAERTRATSGLRSAHWKDYQNFLERLDHAVASQQQIIREAEQNLEACRRRWMARHRQVESLQRVLDRYRDLERQRQDRLQQRVQDELPGPDKPFSSDPDR